MQEVEGSIPFASTIREAGAGSDLYFQVGPKGIRLLGAESDERAAR
jgi:hypothetical protein